MFWLKDGVQLIEDPLKIALSSTLFEFPLDMPEFGLVTSQLFISDLELR